MTGDGALTDFCFVPSTSRRVAGMPWYLYLGDGRGSGTVYMSAAIPSRRGRCSYCTWAETCAPKKLSEAAIGGIFCRRAAPVETDRDPLPARRSTAPNMHVLYRVLYLPTKALPNAPEPAL